MSLMQVLTLQTGINMFTVMSGSSRAGMVTINGTDLGDSTKKVTKV